MTKFFNQKTTFSPLSITLIYAIFSSTWILFTDSLIDSHYHFETLHSSFQTYKGLFFVLITSIFVFFMTNRSFKIQNHLISVLSVLSDINQLIVREKDVGELLQKSCNILASSHIYNNAWIMTLDEEKNVNDLIYSGTFKEAQTFREKIKTNWTPHCISKTLTTDKLYSSVKDTLKECDGCPLANINDFKSSMTIELKHKDKLYGYLNISMHKEYLNNKKELALLKELAGDISYALNNIRLEASLKENEKELIISNDKFEKAFNNTPNIIIISNLKTGKIYDINRTFTNTIGYEKDEIIGKTTFDIDLWCDFNDRKDYIDSFKKLGYVQGHIYTFNTKNKKIITAKVHASLVTIDSQKYILAVAEDISESIKIQAALNESEKKFRLLIEQSPFAIEMYDMDGLQIEVNHAYETLWEFPAKTTLNKFNVLKSEEVEKTGLLKYVKKAYDGEYVNVPIYEFDPAGKTESRGKGRVRSLSTKIFPLKNKDSIIKNIVIMHEDVTEQEETRKLLEEKKRELETVIQEAPNPIMVHNEDGEVLLINKVWEELTGYKYEEINSMDKWISKAYGKDMSTVKAYIDKLYNINTKIDDGEYKIFTKNKETIIWKFSSASLGFINSKRTLISSATDITELKRKDKLLMMQSRHAAMGEMIGMIAHQWRQPISIISMVANNMLLDIALDKFDSAEAEKFSHNILKQTSHLSSTIDDFRNFFKSDKEILKVKLRDIMEETLSIINDSISNNSIELQTSFESDSLVDAYPRELMQVFINIINNAKDAILIDKIKKPIIKINIYEDDKYVITEICDNAKGIDASVLPKIFDPYFTTKDEKVGTGLGLYMSKLIIENHLKGSIEVFNKEAGACFIIKIFK